MRSVAQKIKTIFTRKSFALTLLTITIVGLMSSVSSASPSTFAVVIPAPVGAGSGAATGNGSDTGDNGCNSQALCAYCAKNNPGAAECVPSGTDTAATCDTSQCNLVTKYVNPFINLFSVIFGLIAVISLILGGINFSTSEGDPQKAARAKQRIFNTIFALVGYIFFYAFLQFLVPGGLFNK
jgi:Type IV secretion system pilin